MNASNLPPDYLEQDERTEAEIERNEDLREDALQRQFECAHETHN